MSNEADMKEVELRELEQEKQSMNTDTEKNGCVKVKVPEEKEVKFTGLTKEELMRVAGTTGYMLSDAPSLSNCGIMSQTINIKLTIFALISQKMQSLTQFS